MPSVMDRYFKKVWRYVGKVYVHMGGELCMSNRACFWRSSIDLKWV